MEKVRLNLDLERLRGSSINQFLVLILRGKGGSLISGSKIKTTTTTADLQEKRMYNMSLFSLMHERRLLRDKILENLMQSNYTSYIVLRANNKLGGIVELI